MIQSCIYGCLCLSWLVFIHSCTPSAGLSKVLPAQDVRDSIETAGKKGARFSLFGQKHKAISYSGYRQGQSPTTRIYPSRAQILEDLNLVQRNWDLIRLYDASEHASRVLQVIQENELPIKVMLGAWLGSEPSAQHENQTQVNRSIELAQQYADIVVALSIGNEALVDWSDHRIEDVNVVIAYIKQAKQALPIPITVAENYLPWTQGIGQRLAQVVDFATIHTYPQWEKKNIEEALAYTQQNYAAVKQALPSLPIVIGEAGWTTQSDNERQMQIRYAHEYYQKQYFDSLMAWADQNKIVCFVFEAFDEPWKGADSPAEPEKHWGLFTEQRLAKYAIYELYPERRPEAADRISGPPSVGLDAK